MRRQLRIAIPVLLVALAGVGAWQISQPSEPVYHGKRLSQWLWEYGHPTNSFAPGPAEDAIRHIGTNGIPTLLGLLREEDFLFVSKLTALRFRHRAAFGRLPERVQDWILELPQRTDDKNSAGMWGFGVLGTNAQEAVPELIRLYDESRPRAKSAVAQALAATGPEAGAALHALVRGAASSNAEVRQSAFVALGQVQVARPVIVAALVKGMDETNADIAALAHLLGWFGSEGRQAVPKLTSLLSDANPYVRNAAAGALTSIEGQGAVKAGVVPALIKSLSGSDSTARSRRYALDLLPLFGTSAKEAVPALVLLLNDRNSRERVDAAVALSKIDVAAAVRAGVVPMLTDWLSSTSSWPERCEALRGFRVLGTNAQEAVPTLVSLLSDRNSFICVQAATSLGEIDLKAALKAGAVAALVTNASSPDYGVAALRGTFGTNAIPDLVSLLSNRNRTVRVRADSVLKQLAPKAAAKAGAGQ